MQRQALVDPEASVFGIHASTEYADGSSHQRLCSRSLASGDNHTTALVTRR